MLKTAWTQDRSPMYLVGDAWRYGNWDLRCCPILSWVIGRWESRLGRLLTSCQIPYGLYGAFIVWSQTMKKKSPKPTAVFFGSLHTQTSTTSVSATFSLNLCISYVQNFEQKSLKRMHFYEKMLIKCQLLGYVGWPLSLDAIRNHALTLPWLANLKVSKFLIFLDQTSLHILEKKLRANKQPTPCDERSKPDVYYQ